VGRLGLRGWRRRGRVLGGVDVIMAEGEAC